MPPPTSIEIENGIRGAIYGELAWVLRYPRTPPGLGVLVSVELEDPELEAGRASVVEARPADTAALQRAHTRLFPPVESRDCPSYETAYRGRDIFQQSHVMADVAAFYRAHGLQLGGLQRERPDAIGPELEFMGFLSWKEAAALSRGDDEMVETCRRAQRLFLGDHLGCWGPEYGRRVAVVAGHSFYQALGALIAAWLEADMSRLGVLPGVATSLPMPLPVAIDASAACGCGDDCECRGSGA